MQFRFSRGPDFVSFVPLLKNDRKSFSSPAPRPFMQDCLRIHGFLVDKIRWPFGGRNDRMRLNDRLPLNADLLRLELFYALVLRLGF